MPAVDPRPGIRWPVRVFAYLIVLAVLVPPVADRETWPFTTLKLFSQVRRPVQGGWEVLAVGGDSVERPVPWGALPRSLRFHQHLVGRFPAMTPAERETVCGEWAAALGQIGDDVAGFRVYRVDRRVPSSDGEPAAVIRRRLRYECGQP